LDILLFTHNLGQARYFPSAFERRAMQSKCVYEKLRHQRPKMLDHLRR
jgi:hypothetical protein